jgi:acyl-CoA reductase-like NAD-dependent aldehyde dehydrogenase
MTQTPFTAPAAGRFPPTSPAGVDRALATLRDHRRAWLDVPTTAKAGYLREIAAAAIETAPGFVADAVAAKGVPPELGSEDWIATFITVLRTVRILADSLEHIARTGETLVTDSMVRTRDNGQAAIRVLPYDRWDKVLYAGYGAEVWVDPEVSRDRLAGHLGSIYTKPETARPRTTAVLGAGNVAAIGILDVVYKLFNEGAVVVLKHNPVNDYVAPHVERIFAPLIRDGFLRIVLGGADVGQYLVHHPDVDEIHITGANRTHDTIVFGPGEEGAARKARGEPLLTKPVTSELGNVSPVIVVPGRWSGPGLRLQAERVATQMVQNDGFNCNAAKVIVLSRDWGQKEDFLAELRRVLLSLPERPAYYPGAEERFERFAGSHDDVELLGPRRPGFVPPALIKGVSPDFEHLAFTEEAFCSLAATTELPGGPDEFLAAASAFCNERLSGTLNATILVDRRTRRAHHPALSRAVDDLRYGTVSVNVWGAAAFVLGSTVWGAFPGATLEDVQSGIGFVRNALLVDRPQKSVMWAPFLTLKPPWLVTHRRSLPALRRAAEFEADPGLWRLLKVTAAAARP